LRLLKSEIKTVVKNISGLFWYFTRSRMVAQYRLFGTTYWSSIILGLLTLEVGTDRLCWNVGTDLPICAVLFLGKASALCFDPIIIWSNKIWSNTTLLIFLFKILQQHISALRSHLQAEYERVYIYIYIYIYTVFYVQLEDSFREPKHGAVQSLNKKNNKFVLDHILSRYLTLRTTKCQIKTLISSRPSCSGHWQRMCSLDFSLPLRCEWCLCFPGMLRGVDW